MFTWRATYLNVRELRCLAEGRILPITVSQPLVDVWIPAPDIPDVALEVLHIDSIEPDDSRKQSHIRLSHSVTVVVRPRRLSQLGLSFVKRSKESLHVLRVSFLGRGKARLVDAIVDIVISPFVCLLNLRFQILWEQVELGILLWQEVIEGMIEHPDNLTRLVANDAPLLLVV